MQKMFRLVPQSKTTMQMHQKFMLYAKKMFRLVPPGLEPGTFRVLSERDNHYTTELLDSVNNIKKIKHILSHVLTRPRRFLEI